MSRYMEAKAIYEALGVDTEKALNTLKDVTVSVHCWQGDDVVGFDSKEALSGGIQTTGNYPGKATTPAQLMADFDKALSLMPGKKKLNLHACYAIFADGEYADRDKIEPKHFAPWVAFAKERGMGLDFNPTYFSHPMVKDGLTLSSPDEDVRSSFSFVSKTRLSEPEGLLPFIVTIGFVSPSGFSIFKTLLSPSVTIESLFVGTS